MSFSLSGLASGMDTNTMIQQLMQIERQPLTRLENTKKQISGKQEIFRDLNTKLRTLDNLAFDFTQRSTFQATSATISNEQAISVSSTEQPSQGTYDIQVQQRAQAHVVQLPAHAATDDASGWIGQSFTLHHSSLDSPVVIEAKDTENNTVEEVLEDLKNQINAAQAGVQASVIETSAGQKTLVMTSENLGEEHRVKFGTGTEGNQSVLQDNGGLLHTLGLTDNDGNGEVDAANVAQAYQNASFTVNGVQVTRSTNTIDDVIDGVSFQLLQENSQATISVEQDTENIIGKITEFVDAYNEVIDLIRENTKQEGPLQGDATLRGLDNELHQWVTSIVDSSPEGFQALYEVGITIDKGKTSGSEMTGKMEIDENVLKQKLLENTDGVMSLFRNDEGIAKKIDQNLNTWTGTVNGIITSKVKGFDSEISFIDDRIDQFNRRLEVKEEQLIKQFTAMEVALSQSQNQQQWLSGQLAQLSTGSLI